MSSNHSPQFKYLNFHISPKAMSGQYCENYDFKRERVHCYPRDVYHCCTSSDCAVEELIVSLESQRIFQKIGFGLFCYITNNSLNDWSLGEQSILFLWNLNVSVDLISRNIEILFSIETKTKEKTTK